MHDKWGIINVKEEYSVIVPTNHHSLIIMLQMGVKDVQRRWVESETLLDS